MKVSALYFLLLVFFGYAQTSFAEAKIKSSPTFDKLPTSAILEDYLVLNVALSHFVSLKEVSGQRKSNGDDLIILQNKTPEKSGMLEASQLSCELDGRKKSLPTGLSSSLRMRNVKATLLKSMQTHNKKIIVDNLDKYPDGWKFWDALKKRHPRAKAYAQAWLPGYSTDSKQAVLRFWFGPNAHGATATYMLIKHKNQWKIKWHNLAFYA
jgi:hypothetical protein